MLLFELFDLPRKEISITSVHNVEKELSVDELVGFWLYIWQVLDDFWSRTYLIIYCTNGELIVPRNAYSFDITVGVVFLAACEQLLQELELA